MYLETLHQVLQIAPPAEQAPLPLDHLQQDRTREAGEPAHPPIPHPGCPLDSPPPHLPIHTLAAFWRLQALVSALHDCVSIRAGRGRGKGEQCCSGSGASLAAAGGAACSRRQPCGRFPLFYSTPRCRNKAQAPARALGVTTPTPPVSSCALLAAQA